MRTAPDIKHPGDVAALRLWLIDELNDGRPMAEAVNGVDSMVAARRATKQMRVQNSRPPSQWWSKQVLPDANLYYFGADVVDLMQEVASTVPDVALNADLMPAECGMIVFAKTWWGNGADGGKVPVDAIAWGPAIVPTNPLMPSLSLRSATSIGLLARGASVDNYAPELMPSNDLLDLWEADGSPAKYARPNAEGYWIPLGRTDWVDGWHRADHKEADNTVIVGTGDEASLDQDRAMTLAAWTIIMQPGLSSQSDERSKVGEQAHRRMARKQDRKQQSPPVRVIYLPERSHSGDATGTGTKLDHQVYVAPFWRQQPYGPNSSLRRPVLVRGHIRGPEGTPLVRRDVVRAKITP